MLLEPSFLRELEKAVGANQIHTSTEALERASRDETHGLTPHMPDAVVFPLTHEHVVDIAHICSKYQVSMTPRGAGTGKSGGCVPSLGGVVLDFSKMKRIISINASDLIAVVEPGVLLGDLQEHVKSLGLCYPPDPASLEWCTIGGNVAENAGGPSAVKYGVTKDYVLGLRIVLADGRNFRIGKNTVKGVSGYDLVSLICGSEGTLAFVTEVTVRLLPKPKVVQAAILHFASRKHALDAVIKIRACADIRCIEFLDALSVEALTALGFQKPSAAKALLLIEIDGSNAEYLLSSLTHVDDTLSGEGYLGAVVARDERERSEFWNWRRRLSEAIKKIARFKISEDIVVPLSRMETFLQGVDALVQSYPVRICAFGHAGDGNLHVQILFDEQSVNKQVPAILQELFVQTIAQGGTLTGEHGIGIAKKSYLSLEQGPELIDLQRQIKAVFDPCGLLNPGKFL